jgi:hypothetical protein
VEKRVSWNPKGSMSGIQPGGLLELHTIGVGINQGVVVRPRSASVMGQGVQGLTEYEIARMSGEDPFEAMIRRVRLKRGSGLMTLSISLAIPRR